METNMGPQVIQAIADELDRARQSRTPVEPLTDRYPDFTVADAYLVQTTNIERELGRGRTRAGRKIGLTSKAMQDMFGVGEPDYGVLLDDMILDAETPIPLSRLIQPKVESEMAFFLKKALRGPGITIPAVIQATEAVMPALEIVDSRIRHWRIKLPDTVADNAAAGMLVVGNTMIDPRQLDLQTVGMVFEQNGRIIATAAGAEVLGHPAAAVAWLANKLASFGQGLEAGEIILSGAMTKAVEMVPGDVFRATFGGMGSVKARFVA